MLVVANILQPLIDVNRAIIHFWHNTVGFGWGLSIVGLTVVIRMAILPLTYKSIRSMQALQRLQPEMKRIQERYKEDKKRQQEALMEFYREHKVNPLGSCLPLALQFPFFIGLYQTLKSGGQVNHEIQHSASKGFLFIPDLTKTPHGGVLVALVVIYVATQLTSSLVTMVNVQDKMQRRLLFILPIVFVPVIINFPAGLLVYWITTNLWTIGQQLAVRRFLPPPEPLPAGGASPATARAATGGGGGGRGGGAKARATASDGKADRAAANAESDRAPAKAKAKAGAANGSDGGGPRKAPPPSPRKRKKRTGRRR
jgi:YidC/Oxa1 family membrane protein insertase